MIDSDHINHTYRHCLAEAYSLVPQNQWVVQPDSWLLTSHKTKYGMADVRGRVHINRAFVGSVATDLLEATVRHELAHLCVGLEQGHNRQFRAIERLFQANFKQVPDEQIQQLHKRIGHSWELYACLADQTKVLLKKVHRKHRKYTEYRPGMFRYLMYKGQKIDGFEYVRIQSD
jgi:predicted SprT family Zn-dependent metalloprotease